VSPSRARSPPIDRKDASGDHRNRTTTRRGVSPAFLAARAPRTGPMGLPASRGNQVRPRGQRDTRVGRRPGARRHGQITPASAGGCGSNSRRRPPDLLVVRSASLPSRLVGRPGQASLDRGTGVRRKRRLPEEQRPAGPAALRRCDDDLQRAGAACRQPRRACALSRRAARGCGP
jgi:hypothetical protein